jgi:hypothetical protein
LYHSAIEQYVAQRCYEAYAQTLRPPSTEDVLCHWLDLQPRSALILDRVLRKFYVTTRRLKTACRYLLRSS